MKSRIIGIVAFATILMSSNIASAQTAVRVVFHPIRDNKLALWIAQDAGFFKKNGLAVTLAHEPHERGENAVNSVLAKEIDIAVAGFRDAVKPVMSSGKADLVVIASLASNPFIFIASPEIKTPQDLKGKKIWSALPGHGPDVSTQVVLRHMGLDPSKDVEFVRCEDGCSATLLGQKVKGHSIGVSWTLDGKVSGSLSSRSTLKDLKAAGKNVNVLVDFIDAGLDITAADLMVRKDWLATNRATAKAFLKSLVEATAYAKKNREFTEAIQRKYLLEEYKTGMESKFEDYVLGVLPSKPYPSAKGVEVAIWEKGKGSYFYQSHKPAEFVDASVMQELEAEGVFK
jgi:ABC-type nitrate/sulfonate/bicarbonate transport system substrate-binding protein